LTNKKSFSISVPPVEIENRISLSKKYCQKKQTASRVPNTAQKRLKMVETVLSVNHSGSG
jgi:hypothetical protein